MSATTVPDRRRVLVRGELVHDLTELTTGDPGFRLVLPTPLPILVLRERTGERVDLLTGERRALGSALCGPSTRPWAVREAPGTRVTVLRLRPEALVRLEITDPRPLVDGARELASAGSAAGLEPGADGAELDRVLAERATARDEVLRRGLGAAVGLILAERGLVAAVEVARAAQLPPSELFRVLDRTLGTGPEQLAAAQRLRSTVRDGVPAGAPVGRVLAVLGALRTLPPNELARLGLDHGVLELVLRHGAELAAG
jgi:hypothetical protein